MSKEIQWNLVDFKSILDQLPARYTKAMTDEQFYLAMFHNMWPEFTEEQYQEVIR